MRSTATKPATPAQVRYITDLFALRDWSVETRSAWSERLRILAAQPQRVAALDRSAASKLIDALRRYPERNPAESAAVAEDPEAFNREWAAMKNRAAAVEAAQENAAYMAKMARDEALFSHRQA